MDEPTDFPDDGESDDSVVCMELMGKARGESTTDARRRTNAFKLYQAPIHATRSAASSPRGRAQDSGAAASAGITLVEQLQARYVSPEVLNILRGQAGLATLRARCSIIADTADAEKPYSSSSSSSSSSSDSDEDEEDAAFFGSSGAGAEDAYALRSRANLRKEMHEWKRTLGRAARRTQRVVERKRLADLSSTQALFKREALRFDPGVIAKLHWLFDCTDADRDGIINQAEFRVVYTHLFEVVAQETTEEEVFKMADDDFARDTFGTAGRMNKQAFMASMFQIVDLWTEEITAEAYCTFIGEIVGAFEKAWAVLQNAAACSAAAAAAATAAMAAITAAASAKANALAASVAASEAASAVKAARRMVRDAERRREEKAKAAAAAAAKAAAHQAYAASVAAVRIARAAKEAVAAAAAAAAAATAAARAAARAAGGRADVDGSD